MVMDRDLTWNGKHIVQCAGGVLWSCASETCMVLLTNVIPINSTKREKLLLSYWGDIC